MVPITRLVLEKYNVYHLLCQRLLYSLPKCVLCNIEAQQVEKIDLAEKKKK